MHTRADLFPTLKATAYLNHASVSPLNQRCTDAMTQLMQDYAAHGLDAWPGAVAIRNDLRQNLATLIGCQSQDIALTQNTSHGISIIANEYPWQKGDGLVLVRDEFPGNIVPWLNVVERFELKLDWLDVEDIQTQNAAFQQVMASQPKLLAISWVQYQTGKTTRLETLSAIRQEYGIHVFVDAIQGLGPLKMDLQKTPLDFVATGSHKWLLSPEGCGFLYVHPQTMAQMVPTMVGWTSKENAFDFLFKGRGLVDYQAPLRKDATRYEMATMNALGFAGMGASIALILEMGPAEMSRTILSHANYCREGLRSMGLEPCAGTAGNVSVPMEMPKLKQVHDACREAGVVISIPDGHLRCSAHFYNTKAEIDHYLNTVEAALN